jgi:hypothetical protein
LVARTRPTALIRSGVFTAFDKGVGQLPAAIGYIALIGRPAAAISPIRVASSPSLYARQRPDGDRVDSRHPARCWPCYGRIWALFLAPTGRLSWDVVRPDFDNVAVVFGYRLLGLGEPKPWDRVAGTVVIVHEMNEPSVKEIPQLLKIITVWQTIGHPQRKLA